MLRFVPAALVAAAMPMAAPASLPEANPAMWVVGDSDTTIYLFGTVHLLDGKQDWFKGEVRAAFDSSDELVVEAILPDNLAELQPMVTHYALDPSGRTLSDKIGTEAKAEVDKALAGVGLPGASETFDPWFVSMTLSSRSAPDPEFSPEHGAEAVFRKAAGARGIKVGELEGAEWQLRMFDDMPEATQVKYLAQTVKGMGKTDERLKPMLAAWSAGDVDGLVRINGARADEDPELYRTLFTDRNARWADWVKTRLDRPGTVFVAVGAGHLAGRDSVQDYLARQGVQPMRVMH